MIDKIRSVLLQYWDPIGIKNEPRAQDEYDGYIPEIIRRIELHDRTSLFDYLWRVETLDMAIPLPHGDHILSHAASILAVVDKIFDALDRPVKRDSIW